MGGTEGGVLVEEYGVVFEEVGAGWPRGVGEAYSTLFIFHVVIAVLFMSIKL